MEVHVIPLRDLTDIHSICDVLDYPRENINICRERINKLRQINVDALILEGETLLKRNYVIDKGTNSIIVKLLYSGEYVIGKILRADATRTSLDHEASILRYIEERYPNTKISPKLYLNLGWLLIMEFVDGIPIGTFLDDTLYDLSIDEIKLFLHNVLHKCFLLDKIGVDHGELSNPHKHIYILPDLDAKILDFESASMNRSPKNLTSVYQFLFRSSNAADYLRTLLDIEYNDIIPLLREYKKSPSRDLFDEILRMSNL